MLRSTDDDFCRHCEGKGCYLCSRYKLQPGRKQTEKQENGNEDFDFERVEAHAVACGMIKREVMTAWITQWNL